jgi:hypothetical protein
VLMGLTALQPQSEPKATPPSAEQCESSHHVEAQADWLDDLLAKRHASA